MTRQTQLVASLGIAILLGGFLLPVGATAQTGLGGVSGVVRDSTGGVLPGVTVEVSSPALIEGVRIAITDGEGRYSITELRPGTYTVSFSLVGFSVVRREGVELPAGFTANISAEMTVGSLEETITVTGESPVVDIQNVRTQNTFSRDELDKIPVTRSVAGFASITLGAMLEQTRNQSVGGDQSEALSSSGFSIHGGRQDDQKLLLNGMPATDASFRGNTNRNAVNAIAAQETVYTTGGITAEGETGGVQINIIPKEGSNGFNFYFNANGTNENFQSENLNQDIQDRGLDSVPPVKRIYDVGYGVGGPIKRDKLWFFVSSRWWGSQKYAPGNFFNATQDLSNAIGVNPNGGTTGVVPLNHDPSQPAFTDGYLQDKINTRITWQASEKNKFSFGLNYQRNCDCRRGVDENRAPEAVVQRKYGPSGVGQALWTNPVNNRLLLEAGFTFSAYHSTSARAPGVTVNTISIQQRETGFVHGANYSTNANYARASKKFDQWNERFAISYVTGSHSFKTGVTLQSGLNLDRTESNVINTAQGLAPVRYRFRRGVPERVYQYTELENEQRLKANLSYFVQDQWTIDRLTLNLGLRFSWFNAYVPPQTIRAPGDDSCRVGCGRDSLFLADNFGPDGDVHDGAQDVPDWKDVQPRVGFAYDLTGSGKTAVKASLGRYMAYEGTTGIPRANNLARRLARIARRSWNDANENWFPDCDLTDPFRNGECGTLNDTNLGSAVPSTTYSDDVLLHDRRGNWQSSVSVEHELMPGLAFDAGWFRTSYFNFRATNNRNWDGQAFDTFCVTTPSDPELGSSSGQELCGFFDISDPELFGQNDQFITRAKNFGDQTEVYNGVDIGVTGRFGDGGLVRGGVSMGRTETDNCDVVRGNPQIALEVGPDDGIGATAGGGFCNAVNTNQSQFKMAGSYPLPWWDIEVAATYQNNPGLNVWANLEFDSDETTLGRELNDGEINVAILEPFTESGERINQLDLRFAKRINFGGGSLTGQFDIYNIGNSATVLSENFDYGDEWRRPLSILSGRLVKFGVIASF